MLVKVRKVDDIEARFSYLLRRDEKVLQESLQRWFAFSNKQIQNDLRTKFQKFSVSDVTDWDFIEEQGKTIIKPAAMNIIQTGGNEAYKTLQVGVSFDILNEEAVKAANKFTADLVTEVNQGTKKGIRSAVSAGIKEGKSMDRIAREIRPLVGLTSNQASSVTGFRNIISNKEKYPRLTPEQIDKKVQRYADKTHRRRIQSIARTETARAQNIGYAQGMDNIGVMELEFSISPVDACPICESLDGMKYPVKEAGGVIPVHPRCRCAMLPVIAGKTARSTVQAQELLPEHIDDLVSRWDGAISRSNKWVLKDKLRKLGFDTTGKPLGTLPPITPPPVITPKPLPLGKLPQDVQDLVGRWQAASSRSNKWVIQNKLKQMGYDVKTGTYKPTGVPLPKPIDPASKVTQQKWERSLTADEREAIEAWQGGGYQDMRFLELGGNVEELSGPKYYTKNLLDKLHTVLDRAPNYEGVIYRGGGFHKLDVPIEAAKKGSRFTFNTTSSFTKELSHAKDMAIGWDEKAFVIKVRTKTGVDISRLGGMAGAGEEEVLSRKGTQYIVRKVTKKKGYTLLEVEEISKLEGATVTAKPIPKPKIPKGVLKQDNFNKLEGWDKRLAIHKTSLKERFGFDLEALNLNKPNAPEYKSALAKFKTTLKSYTKPEGNIDNARKQHRIFGGDASVQKKFERGMTHYYDTVEDIGGTKTVAHYNKKRIDTWTHEKPEYRPRCDPENYKADFSVYNSIELQFHEYGHILEVDNNVRTKAFNWASRRGRGQMMPINKLSTATNDTQLAFKDKFIDPYVGKVYDDGSTEVISIGMAQFTNYGSMMKFAKKDFDHFAFVHGILTGAI